jgi:hypothetical protein
MMSFAASAAANDSAAPAKSLEVGATWVVIQVTDNDGPVIVNGMVVNKGVYPRGSVPRHPRVEF